MFINHDSIINRIDSDSKVSKVKFWANSRAKLAKS